MDEQVTRRSGEAPPPGSEQDPGSGGDDQQVPAHLPTPVRQRVGALAVEAFGRLTAEEVPAPLRAVHRFAPARRARLATAPVLARLERDEPFRRRLAVEVGVAHPDVAALVEQRQHSPSVDPGELAAVTYLLRPPDWLSYLTGLLQAQAQQAAETRVGMDRSEAASLREELTASRAAADERVASLRAELATTRATVDQLRRALRSVRAELAAARAEVSALAHDRDQAVASACAAQAERDQVRRDADEQVKAAQAMLAAQRSDRRRVRELEDSRTRLLVDTIVAAASGLRRELALPPAQVRPADVVASTAADTPAAPTVDRRGRDLADPRLLDDLLGLPQVHLIVDGYNVTKNGFGDLPLAVQRQRLLAGLAGLAAQTHAEITCCFDGAALDGHVTVSVPRGVRILFSQPGETADELIRQLVHAEPHGRPLVVISTDREVATSVRRAGAHALPSDALLRRLART